MMLRWSVGTCWTLPSRGGEASTPSGQSSPGSARGDLTPHLPLLPWEEPRRVQNAGAGRGFGEPPVQPSHLTEGETEAWRRNGIFQSHTAQPWSDGVWSSHSTLLNPPPLAKRAGLDWACTDVGTPICSLELGRGVPSELEHTLASSRTGFEPCSMPSTNTICLLHW